MQGGTPFTSENVKSAIDILCQPTHQQHKNADEFLVQFSATQQAWNISVDLLQSENYHYQYIGAQTLFMKTSKQWSDLRKEDRDSFRSFLITTLMKFYSSGKRVIWTRLCLSLSMFTLHRISEEDVNLRTVNLLSFFTNGSSDLESAYEPLLQWLLGIAEQSYCNDLTNNAQVEIRRKLTEILENILDYILAFLKRNNTSRQLQNNALSCLKSWIQFGIPLHYVYADDSILQIVFNCLRERDLFCVSADVLLEILTIHNNTKYDNVVLKYMNMLCDLATQIYSHCLTQHDDDICRELVKLSVGFAEVQIQLISQNIVDTSPAYKLSKFILQATSHHNREIVELTFDFWSSLAGRIKDQSADSLLLGFVDVMTRQLQYPNDYDEYDIEEQESFSKYRADASDTLLSVYYILLPKYFSHMTMSLQSRANPTWQFLESCIYIICAASDAARSNQINQCISTIISIANSSTQLKLKSTIVRCIGLYAHYFSTVSGEVIIWALNYVMDNVFQGDFQASKSFVNICESCVKSENGMSGKMWENLTIVCVQQMGKLNVDFCVNVLQGLSHVAANMNENYEIQKNILFIMFKPILERMNMILENNEPSDKLIDEFCKFKACLQAFELDKNSSLPLMMKQIWSTLESIFLRFESNENVIEKLCDLIKYITLSAGDECVGESYMNVLCVIYLRKNYGFLMESIGYLSRGHTNDNIFRILSLNFSNLLKSSFNLLNNSNNSDIHISILDGLYSLLYYVYESNPNLILMDQSLTEQCIDTAVFSLQYPNSDVNKKICKFFEEILTSGVKFNGNEAWQNLFQYMTPKLISTTLKLILLQHTNNEQNLIRILIAYVKYPRYLNTYAMNTLLDPMLNMISSTEKSFFVSTLIRSHGINKMKSTLTDFRAKINRT